MKRRRFIDWRTPSFLPPYSLTSISGRPGCFASASADGAAPCAGVCSEWLMSKEGYLVGGASHLSDEVHAGHFLAAYASAVKKILVVEDDPVNGLVLLDFLT